MDNPHDGHSLDTHSMASSSRSSEHPAADAHAPRPRGPNVAPPYTNVVVPELPPRPSALSRILSVLLFPPIASRVS
ncbi:hypothetical protein PHLGIDRAFT_115257 [Phlebiopsis gigantea 11061_1 CR5-6]|uniref:Uncharacterized protein n=1 Tax=Phlebiopsis gigantea (strain 11061_1 CR5-6) TaxID=745531 RepID=A0A0C3NZ28_PHLG1|nr:hypothetical protein PHLGIDRAFT_115257 [Phlebiopsis gigantea 11061_1 CR5-6]